MKGTLAILAGLAGPAIVLLMNGCAWHEEPQYTSVEYAVSGNASNLTIAAVTDEVGTSRTFSVAALPWSLDYTNETHVVNPPVYLRIEVTPAAAAIASGTADSASADHLVDSTADFLTAGVRVGDVALKTGSGAVSLVTAVSATDLTLTAGDNPFPLGTEAYQVFRMVSVSATVTDGGRTIARTTLSGWQASPLTATVIAENYTVP